MGTLRLNELDYLGQHSRRTTHGYGVHLVFLVMIDHIEISTLKMDVERDTVL